MYKRGLKILFARLENPAARPAGAPKSVPKNMPSASVLRLTKKCGQITCASAAKTGSVCAGVGNAGDCTAALSAHQMRHTATIPHAMLKIFRKTPTLHKPFVELQSNRAILM
jgi:hypothetical protein